VARFLILFKAMKTRKQTLAIAVAIAVGMMLIPATAAGQTVTAQPIHQAIEAAGVHVDNLRVIPVEGIVIVRGKVHDQESLERVSSILNELGYLRVANLMKITPAPNDEEIERIVERELHITRALEGAQLRVNSLNGIVTINGNVQHELQRDAAADIVRSVDGVREVQLAIDLR
jgi:osmotically-inducible protein OsmY